MYPHYFTQIVVWLYVLKGWSSVGWSRFFVQTATESTIAGLINVQTALDRRWLNVGRFNCMKYFLKFLDLKHFQTDTDQSLSFSDWPTSVWLIGSIFRSIMLIPSSNSYSHLDNNYWDMTPISNNENNENRSTIRTPWKVRAPISYIPSPRIKLKHWNEERRTMKSVISLLDKRWQEHQKKKKRVKLLKGTKTSNTVIFLRGQMELTIKIVQRGLSPPTNRPNHICFEVLFTWSYQRESQEQSQDGFSNLTWDRRL